MSLKQFNASYVAEEDRVLFRVTTASGEEYRLWLTRARVAELLALGAKAAVVKLEREHVELLPQQAKAVAEFKQQAVKQSTQFTEFEPANRLPLGAEPLLVRSMKMELQEQVLALQLELNAGRVLTLRLNDDMASKLRILLETISERARWHIHLNAPAIEASAKISGSDAPELPAIADPTPKKILH
jgi:hypothetical protein